MRKAYTLVEFLLVLTISLLVITLMGTVYYRSTRSTETIRKEANVLNSAVSFVDFHMANIYKYIRSFAGHVDELSISATKVEGVVRVLTDEYRAQMVVRNLDEKAELVWKVGDEEKIIIPPVPNVSMHFERPSNQEIGEYGAGVFMVLEKWVEVGGKRHRLVRRLFIPFLNVD